MVSGLPILALAFGFGGPKPMAMRFAPVLGASALILASLPAAADDVFDGVTMLPGVVEDVRIGGTWDRDDAYGFYRIVVARFGGNTVSARLFVQWVAYDDTGGASLLDTIEITEVAELGIDVIDYQSESDLDGLQVFIQADNPADPAVDSYELFVFSPGSYIFDVASN